LITRSPLVQYLSLNAIYFGASFMWNTLHPIVLPLLLLNYGSEGTKNTRLGMLTFAGYALAMFIQPLSGALSDQTRHRWGKRRPWIVYGGGVAIGALLLLALSGSFWMLAAGYLLLQVAMNAVMGPSHGLIPDSVREGHRGLAVGLRSLLDMLGIIAAAFFAGLLADRVGADAPVGLLMAAVMLGGGTLLTVRATRRLQGSADAAPRSRRQSSREVFDVGRMRKMLDVDMNEHPGYLRLLISRFWLLLATSLVLSFGFYYFQDALQLDNPAGAVSNLMTSIGIPMGLVVLPAAILSERWGRKGLSLGACAMMAICISLLSLARTMPAIRILGLIAGVGMGTFVSVNWAWATDLAPLDQAGKYLGLANLATAGTSALGRLMGPVIDLANAWRANIGYTLVFVLAGASILTALYYTLRIPETRGRYSVSDPLAIPLDPSLGGDHL